MRLQKFIKKKNRSIDRSNITSIWIFDFCRTKRRRWDFVVVIIISERFIFKDSGNPFDFTLSNVFKKRNGVKKKKKHIFNFIKLLLLLVELNNCFFFSPFPDNHFRLFNPSHDEFIFNEFFFLFFVLVLSIISPRKYVKSFLINVLYV